MKTIEEILELALFRYRYIDMNKGKEVDGYIYLLDNEKYFIDDQKSYKKIINE